MPPARISLTLSRHFSLSFIASGRFSEIHPVSSYSYCMYVRAGRPAFARPYTPWTLTKRLEKKLDGNYTRMLRAILNKSLRQHPTKRKLYGHLSPITKTIQFRRTRHTGHCWRSGDEVISDIYIYIYLIYMCVCMCVYIYI